MGENEKTKKNINSNKQSIKWRKAPKTKRQLYLVNLFW